MRGRLNKKPFDYGFGMSDFGGFMFTKRRRGSKPRRRYAISGLGCRMSDTLGRRVMCPKFQ
jgi:hypothetical protein